MPTKRSRAKVGTYCSICRGPHKLRHGKKKAAKRGESRATRSRAGHLGWAHRRHISPIKERARDKRRAARKTAKKRARKTRSR